MQLDRFGPEYGMSDDPEDFVISFFYFLTFRIASTLYFILFFCFVYTFYNIKSYIFGSDPPVFSKTTTTYRAVTM